MQTLFSESKKNFKWNKTLIKEFERAFFGYCNQTKENVMPSKIILPVEIMLNFSFCGIHGNEKYKM